MAIARAHIGNTSEKILTLYPPDKALCRSGHPRLLKGYPEGGARSNNPSFPLKASSSDPEGEAWATKAPKPIYPEGVAFPQ